MRTLVTLVVTTLAISLGTVTPATAAVDSAAGLTVALDRLGSDISSQAVIIVKRDKYATSTIEVDGPTRYKVTDGHTVRIVDGTTTYDSLTEADKARARKAGKTAIYVTSTSDDPEGVSLFDNADLVRAAAALGTVTSKTIPSGTRYVATIVTENVDLTGSDWTHSSALIGSGIKSAQYRIWTDKAGRITRIRGNETVHGLPKPLLTTWKATYSKDKVKLDPVAANLALSMHEVDALPALTALEKAAYDVVDSTYHLVDTTGAKASIDLIVTAAAGVPTPTGLIATYEGSSLKLAIDTEALCLTATDPVTVTVATC